MIDVRSIRIGSIIEKEWIDESRSTETLDTEELSFALESPHLYHPIPLSESLLIDSGFEWDGSQIEHWKNGNIYLYWHAENKTLSANLGHIEHIDVTISYVHQLQNLYFTLTGKELPIKK